MKCSAHHAPVHILCVDELLIVVRRIRNLKAPCTGMIQEHDLVE